MKPSCVSGPQTFLTAVDDSDDDFDFKDLCSDDPGIDQATTPLATIPLATTAFQAAGYEVREAEKSEYHPVYTFKLTRLTAPRFASLRELNLHVWQILCGVGLRVPRNPPLASRYGGRIIVSFIWDDVSQ